MKSSWDCLWEGLWGPPGRVRWGLQDWSWRAGLQRVGPVWLEEQFSQRLGPGPDLSVAGVEGERLVWIKAREGRREEGGGREWEGGKDGVSGSLAVSPQCGKGTDQRRYGMPFLRVHFCPTLQFARTILKAAPEARGQSLGL